MYSCSEIGIRRKRCATLTRRYSYKTRTQEGKVSNTTYEEMAANLIASSIAKGQGPGFRVHGNEVEVTPVEVGGHVAVRWVDLLL